MKQRADILKSLENLFLATQDKVTELPDGSVIKSILFSNAAALEDLYKYIEETLGNLYINQAEGIYLDKLIEGFSGLKRKPARRSSGYVLLELGEPLSNANINKFTFSFARYEPSTDVLDTNIPSSVQVPISIEPGTTISVVLIQPVSIKTNDKLFLIDQTTKEQVLVSQFKELILRTVSVTGKPVKYIVLPVVTEQTGKASELNIGDIDTIINMGIPVRIFNPYSYKTTDLQNYSIVDPDGVTKTSAVSANIIFLGYNAEISGGKDRESDEEYRKRFYLYLDSLSKGTAKSIEYGISELLPDLRVSVVQTNKKGEVDVILYLTRPVVPNLVEELLSTLEDYRPAGIKINIFTTNIIPISVVFDAKGTSLTQIVEKSRLILKDILSAKEIGESLSYTDINEALDINEIEFMDNVFYGLYLHENLFELYKTTFLSTYSQLITEPLTNFYSVYSAITEAPETVRLFDASRSTNGYPLIEFVRAAKKANSSAFDAHLGYVISAIQNCPATISDLNCLTELATAYPDLYVTLQDVEILLGEQNAQYYKIKLLTVPNILNIKTSTAETLIEKVITHDVYFLTRLDTLPITLTETEKLLLAVDTVLNNKVFKSPYLVGARPYEFA